MFVYVLVSCSVYVLMLLRSYVLMFWCSYVILFLVGSETDVESEWARSGTEADSKWNRGQFQWTASGPNIISGPSWTLCGVYWAPWALGIRFHPDPKYKDRQLGRLIPGCDPHRDWPVGGLWIAGRALGRSQTGINLPSCRSLYFGSGWRQASQASQSKPATKWVGGETLIPNFKFRILNLNILIFNPEIGVARTGLGKVANEIESQSRLPHLKLGMLNNVFDHDIY